MNANGSSMNANGSSMNANGSSMNANGSSMNANGTDEPVEIYSKDNQYQVREKPDFIFDENTETVDIVKHFCYLPKTIQMLCHNILTEARRLRRDDLTEITIWKPVFTNEVNCVAFLKRKNEEEYYSLNFEKINIHLLTDFNNWNGRATNRCINLFDTSLTAEVYKTLKDNFKIISKKSRSNYRFCKRLLNTKVFYTNLKKLLIKEGMNKPFIETSGDEEEDIEEEEEVPDDKIKCFCGGIYLCSNKSRHLKSIRKSNKHLCFSKEEEG